MIHYFISNLKTMKVSEALKRDIIKVKRTDTLRSILNSFKDFHRLPLIPVVDTAGFLIGVVYADNLLDILRPSSAKIFRAFPFIEVKQDVFDLDPAPAMGDLLIVDDIMDKQVVSINDSDTLEEAYRKLSLHRKEQLPVTGKDGRLLGIIGIFDIILRMFREKGIL